MENSNTGNGSRKPLTARELEIFCDKTAMVIKSGMMVYAGVEMMARDTADKRIKGILDEVAGQLSDNESLEAALAATGAFPSYMVHMVAIGTESGKLDHVMEALAIYYKNQYEMKESLKSAIAYPAVLMIMMLAVLVFLAAKVMPVFEKVFHSLGTGLSTQAAFIMKIGAFLSKFSLVLVIVAVVAIVFAIFLSKTNAGRRMWSSWVSQRKFNEKFAVSSFASSMSLMLSSGLDPQAAMSMAGEMVANEKVKDKVKRSLALLEAGEDSFLEVIQKSELFSNTAEGILSVGSASGSVDTAMKYVADFYEEDFWSSAMKKISLIEPVSIAVMSVMVGLVLVSVMLPLLGVMASIG